MKKLILFSLLGAVNLFAAVKMEERLWAKNEFF